MQFEVAYDRELLKAAAECHIRHFFSGKGRWLLAACVVNGLGFGAALALGAKLDLVTAWVAFIVAVGPLYCAYLFYVFPTRYASRVARFLAPTARISLTASALEFTAHDRVVPVPWNLVTAVRDCPSAFVLEFSQFAHSFTVIPKIGLPSGAYDFLATKVGKGP